MKKLQTVLSMFLTLILIGLFIFWYLLRTSNLEQTLTQIHTELENFTHAPVHIEGKLQFQLLPKPVFKLKSIDFGSPSNTSPYWINLKQVSLQLKLLPMLQKRILFKHIDIKQFSIQWRSMPALPSSAPNSSYLSPLASRIFQVDKLSMHHGNIDILLAKTSLHFQNAELIFSPLDLNQPLAVNLKSDMRFKLPQEREQTLPIQFNGTIQIPAQCPTDAAKCLDAFHINGQLHAENINLGSLMLTNMNANLQTKSNTLLLNPLTIKLYNGASYGDLSFNLATYKLNINQTATHLNASPIINTLLSPKHPFSGNLDFSIHTQTDLKNKTTSGNGSFNLTQGQIAAFNLSEYLKLVRQKLHRILNPGPTQVFQTTSSPITQNPLIFQGQTPFNQLSMQFSLEPGRLTTQTFSFKNADLIVHGNGYFNLPSQIYFAQIYAHLVGTQGRVEQLQQLLGGSFPIRAAGTWPEVNLTPEVNRIIPFMHHIIIQGTLTNPIDTVQQQLQTFFTLTP